MGSISLKLNLTEQVHLLRAFMPILNETMHVLLLTSA